MSARSKAPITVRVPSSEVVGPAFTSREVNLFYDKIMQKMDGVEYELHQTKRGLERLQRAIPPLPQPQKLYDKIVSLCFDHHSCTEAVTSLEKKVRRLSLSSKPFKERLLEIDSFVLEVDNLRLQFLYCRSQLRTLYSVPPLLIALDKMSREFWESLMNQPQEVDGDEPLLMDLKLIENVTSDHLETLCTLRSDLNNFRKEAENMEGEDVLSFEKEVHNQLARLGQQILDSKDSIIEALEAKNNSPDQSQPKHNSAYQQNGAEGIMPIREESRIIEDNINFMEGVEELGANEQNPEEQDDDAEGEESEEETHDAEDEVSEEEIREYEDE
ncbi:hypothetical protein OSTOST_17350, partial [Ostertagia ostertagi]